MIRDIRSLIGSLNSGELGNVKDVDHLIRLYSDPSSEASMSDSIQLWNSVVRVCNNMPSELKSIHAHPECRIKELAVIVFERSMGEFDEFKGLKLGEMYLRLGKAYRLIKDMTRHRLYLEKSKSVLGMIAKVPMLSGVCRNRLEELRALLFLELILVGDVLQMNESVDGDVLGSALIEEIERDSDSCRYVECLGKVIFSKTIKVQLYSRYVDWLLFAKRLQEAIKISIEVHKEYPRDDTAFLSLVKCRVTLKLPIEAELLGQYKDETKAVAAEIMAKVLGTGKTMELVPDLPFHSKISLTLADPKMSQGQKAEMLDFLLAKASPGSLEGEERCVFQLFEAADRAGNPELGKRLFEICLQLGERTKSNVDLDVIRKRIFDCCLSLGKVEEAKEVLGIREGWPVQRFKLACIEEDREDCLKIAQGCPEEELPELISILQDHATIGIEGELIKRELKDAPFLVLLHLMIERGSSIADSTILNRLSTASVNEENASGVWNLCLLCFNLKQFSLCKSLAHLFRQRFALGEEEKRAALVLLILAASEYTEPNDVTLLEHPEGRGGSKRKRAFVKLEAEELPLIIRLATLRLQVKLDLPLDDDDDDLEVLIRLAQLLYFDPQIDQKDFGKVLGMIVKKAQDGCWNDAIPLCVRSMLEGEHFMREQLSLALITHLAKREEYPGEEREWVMTYLYNRALKYKALSEFEKCKELVSYAKDLVKGNLEMERRLEIVLQKLI